MLDCFFYRKLSYINQRGYTYIFREHTFDISYRATRGKKENAPRIPRNIKPNEISLTILRLAQRHQSRRVAKKKKVIGSEREREKRLSLYARAHLIREDKEESCAAVAKALTSSFPQGPTQDLFELLERVQSSRLDDQRCVLPPYFSQVRRHKEYLIYLFSLFYTFFFLSLRYIYSIYTPLSCSVGLRY